MSITRPIISSITKPITSPITGGAGSNAIVFDFSGSALPSGVTYSGPTNMYVPQSDGSYELVTSGQLLSDEAIYPPAGFTDYIGNKTFAGAVVGNIQGGGSLQTGAVPQNMDNNGSDTLTVVGVTTSDSDMNGLPSIQYRLQRTSVTGTSAIYIQLFTSEALGRVDAVEGDVFSFGMLIKFTDLTTTTGISTIQLGLNSMNSGGGVVDTTSSASTLNFSLQQLKASITCSATTDYVLAPLQLSFNASGDIDITFKIAAPQLINKLSLPLCIANGSSDSAIVVTSGSCTKASGVSLNPKLSVVLDYISQNGEVGQSDLINPSNARNFDISSSNGSTSLHAFTHNSTKHAIIEALAGSVYTSKLENDDVLMGGVTNRVVYAFGEEGIKISLNGGTTATETWEEYVDAGILTKIGFGCSAAGSLPAGIGIKIMTIYPNTEFSAAECQSRSAL